MSRCLVLVADVGRGWEGVGGYHGLGCAVEVHGYVGAWGVT
jgi:hypothetical protein